MQKHELMVVKFFKISGHKESDTFIGTFSGPENCICDWDLLTRDQDLKKFQFEIIESSEPKPKLVLNTNIYPLKEFDYLSIKTWLIKNAEIANNDHELLINRKIIAGGIAGGILLTGIVGLASLMGKPKERIFAPYDEPSYDSSIFGNSDNDGY